MTRKSFLIAAGMLAVILAAARQDRADWGQIARSAYQRHREAAIQMNVLAGQIHSLDDSRKLVDAVAVEFADELPPLWATRSFRDRIARAEYETATDAGKLIPEERVADAWNQFMQEIGASEDARVNVADIHNLRDGEYSAGKVFWNRGSQTVWTMPNIHAVGADEKVADGCRALEAIRVLSDIGLTFENLRGARKMVQQGVLTSDLLEQQQKQTAAQSHSSSLAHTDFRVVHNPVDDAGRRYVREHGVAGMTRAVEALLNDLFPTKG